MVMTFLFLSTDGLMVVMMVMTFLFHQLTLLISGNGRMMVMIITIVFIIMMIEGQREYLNTIIVLVDLIHINIIIIVIKIIT